MRRWARTVSMSVLVSLLALSGQPAARLSAPGAASVHNPPISNLPIPHLRQPRAFRAGAFERVRREWPWIEMFTVWNLSYTSLDAEMQGFSIIESDRTSRPALHVIPRLRRQLD